MANMHARIERIRNEAEWRRSRALEVPVLLGTRWIPLCEVDLALIEETAQREGTAVWEQGEALLALRASLFPATRSLAA